MKKILFLLALLPFIANAQPYPVYQGQPTQATIYNGTLGSLRGIKLPHLDSSKNYNWYSDIYMNKTTGKLMYRDSVLGKDVVVADAGSILSKDSAVFTGTLAQARLLQIAPPALIIKDYGGGLFIKNDTVTVDNTGTQIITAGGQGYSRLGQSYIIPEWFGAISNDTLDDAPFFNAAAIVAERLRVNLEANGNYLFKTQFKLTNAPLIGVQGQTTITIDSSFVFTEVGDGRRYSCILNTNFKAQKDSTADSIVISGVNIISYIKNFSVGPSLVALANTKYSDLGNFSIVSKNGSSRATLLDYWGSNEYGNVHDFVIDNQNEIIVGGGFWIRNIVSEGANPINNTHDIKAWNGTLISKATDEVLAVYGVRGVTENIYFNNLSLRADSSSVNHSVLYSVFPLNDGSASGINAAVRNVHFDGGKIEDKYFTAHVYRVGQSGLDEVRICDNISITNTDFIVGKKVVNTGFVARNISGVHSSPIVFNNNTIICDTAAGTINITNGILGFDKVENNYLFGKFTNAIASNVFVSNNTVVNTTGIGLLNNDVAVRNNVTSLSHGLLYNNGSRFYEASYNTIVNTDTTAAARYGVYLQSTTPKIKLLNNNIRMSLATKYAFSVESTDTVIIVGNDVRNARAVNKSGNTPLFNVSGNTWNGVRDDMRSSALANAFWTNSVPIGSTAFYSGSGQSDTVFYKKMSNTNGNANDWKAYVLKDLNFMNYTRVDSAIKFSPIGLNIGQNDYRNYQDLSIAGYEQFHDWLAFTSYQATYTFDTSTNNGSTFGTLGTATTTKTIVSNYGLVPTTTYTGRFPDNLFAQKTDISGITISDASNAVRLTIAGTALGFSSVKGLELVGYNGARAVNILVETSLDAGVTWSTIGSDSNVNVSLYSYKKYLTPITNNPNRVRITLISTVAASGNTLSLSSIKLLTDRNGVQGGGREYSLPFTWGGNKDVFMGGNVRIPNADTLKIGNLTGVLRADNGNVSVDNNIYTKAQTDSAIAAKQVFAKNGIRKQSDTVKLGLELAPPYTNGLINEPTFLISGDIATGNYWGMMYNESNATPLSIVGKPRNTFLGIDFGDPTGGFGEDAMSFSVRYDSTCCGTLFTMRHDSMTIGSNVAGGSFSGLNYYGDYSANYTDRSIPDVGWVKGYVADTNVVTSSGDIDLIAKGYYTFTGTTGIWDLPPVNMILESKYTIINMGSGNLTINAPINTLWDSGTISSSSIIPSNSVVSFYTNGIYWVVLQ